MKRRNTALWLILACLACPGLAVAGEYKVGAFEFDLPGSWQVRTKSETVLAATQGKFGSAEGALLKVELCVSTEAKPCEAVMFFPPKGASPENFFCGKTEPVSIKHANGLNEIRKICSVSSPGGESNIGMIFLTHGKHNLGVMLFAGKSGPAPSEFMDSFLSLCRRMHVKGLD